MSVINITIQLPSGEKLPANIPTVMKLSTLLNEIHKDAGLKDPIDDYELLIKPSPQNNKSIENFTIRDGDSIIVINKSESSDVKINWQSSPKNKGNT